MTDQRTTSSTTLSRRRWLFGAASTAGATCLGLATVVTAQPANAAGQLGCSVLIPRKSSKQDAHHLWTASSFKSCSSCRFFLSPDRCIVVEGPTSGSSQCALWALNDGRPLGCIPDQTIEL